MTATARDVLAGTGCLLTTISELAPKFGTEDVRTMADVVALAQLAALADAGFAVRSKVPTEENLLALAGWLIGDDWDWNDIDGFDKHDVLVEYGLMKGIVATEKDIDDDSEFGIGDTLYKLTELGKAARATWLESKK